MSIERKTSVDPISQSADIVADNLDKLKQLFPSVFTEGNIDFEAFRELLGDKIETDPEYYRFTWPGKAMAKAEARKPSRGTLRPAKDESVNWDTTKNLYIEGDNLEVLKLLQKSYANKVKMIYIDPPYNTGKDFVYKDNYKDNLASYNEKFNRTDADGNLLSSASETNQEGSARYHSNWLNMMCPRLTLARNLLKDDGVIFVSIDDNEVNNLMKLGNEIFGEESFISKFIWKKKQGGGNDSNHIVVEHEYIICFCKNKSKLTFNLDRNYKLDDALYPFNDDKGEYGLVTLDKSSIRFSETLVFDIKDENGKIYRPRIVKGKQACWRWGQDKVKKDYKSLVFKNGKVYTKYYRPDGITPKSLLINTIYGRTETGNDDIKKIFNNLKPFSYPKPVSLIKHFLMIGSSKNDIILDFFSGSATIGHSIIELNSEDGANRKYIQVQLPELTDEKSEAYEAGYKNICEIAKERIRLAGKKILKENPEQKDKLDIGFKVFKLDESNIKTWETDPEKLDANLFLEDVIKSDRKEEDVLYEILLKYGLDLTLPIQEKIIDNQKLYAIGGGALLVYLGDNTTSEIAQEIINWAKELGAINPQAVFKDSGFHNSQDKVNTLQLLKSNNITDVWSI